MLLKRNLLWIVFFGTMIGLSETLIGSANIPFRSVILTSLSLMLLSVARYQIPKAGSSFLIILIAVLFKINNLGFYSCTTNVFLCGPTAVLILGICYEITASLLLSEKPFKYRSFVLTGGIAAIATFALFAMMNTFLLGSWSTSRLFEYIFFKGTLTAIASGAISLLMLYVIRNKKSGSFAKGHPYLVKGALGLVILALWILGTVTKF